MLKYLVLLALIFSINSFALETGDMPFSPMPSPIPTAVPSTDCGAELAAALVGYSPAVQAMASACVTGFLIGAATTPGAIIVCSSIVQSCVTSAAANSPNLIEQYLGPSPTPINPIDNY